MTDFYNTLTSNANASSGTQQLLFVHWALSSGSSTFASVSNTEIPTNVDDHNIW